MRNIVIMRGTGLPPREPEASCEACGARGTVGRAIRTAQDGEPLEVHRFCARCWPEESARYQARWREEDRLASEAWLRSEGQVSPPTRGMALESATWHITLDLLADSRREMRRREREGAAPLRDEDLTRLANEIRQQAPDMEGPIPLEVDMFLQRYGAPAG
jgi:hypothetical protein